MEDESEGFALGPSISALSLGSSAEVPANMIWMTAPSLVSRLFQSSLISPFEISLVSTANPVEEGYTVRSVTSKILAFGETVTTIGSRKFSRLTASFPAFPMATGVTEMLPSICTPLNKPGRLDD